MIRKHVLTVLFVLYFHPNIDAQALVKARPQQGEGVYALLRRYHLPTNSNNINKFLELNRDVLGATTDLNIDFYYHMPIHIHSFNGINIRSTLGITDYQLAKSIQNYNEELQRSGIRAHHYTVDKEVWVPIFLLPSDSPDQPPAAIPKSRRVDAVNFPMFGPGYRSVDIIDYSLRGYHFYLVSGHGGPDPGAYGVYGNQRLYEDEYAYDITLRLARRLIEHGATVHMIVLDRNDGIRDQAVLRGDHDEYYSDGTRISRNTKTRLAQRANIINGLYRRNQNSAKGQYTIVIHVDSRSNSQRIDIFYYHKKNNNAGRRFAQTLHRRVQKEYAEHQPGRGYGGTITWRSLYMLENVQPTTVYIELANIRNKRDQDRLVIVNNRQAVANWLCEGVKDFVRE
ncbi:N-acetylmuramoyl-L-alanine amidase [candidate division KSB1 bacterium]|nr:N-acetylmuramoyl-L-alanine amidase [candidate division KSB1 bacterium]